MSAWVLIITLWTGGSQGGVAIKTIEFRNQLDCQTAQKSVTGLLDPRSYRDIKAVCVEKHK